jgi:hypothetical protein
MKMKRLILILSFFVLTPQTAFGQDALDLLPGSSFAALGQEVELEVDAAFASAVLGGEVRVDYDRSVLHLVAVDWNLAYGDDSLLRCPPGASPIGARGCEGDVAFVALGSLAGLPDGIVASLIFDAVGEGTTTVSLNPVSPFSDLAGGTVAVTHADADVTVVPEPGLVTALLSGCLGLLAMGRRRRSDAPRAGCAGRQQS